MSTEVGLAGRLAGFGVVDRDLSERESWMTFFCLFFFCGMTMMNNLRVTPVLLDVAASYGLQPADAGLAISVFAITGLVFSFPGAWFMHKFGVKSMLLISAAVTIVGTMIGLVAINPTVFLVSRVLEGVACGIASTIVPNVIPRIFPQEKMGLVMGIWSLWVTPGLVVGLISTPLLYGAFGVRSTWVFAIVLELVCTIWVFLCCKIPRDRAVATAPCAEGSPAHVRVRFKSALVVAVSMFCWGALYNAVNIYLPTFMQEAYNASVLLSSMFPLILSAVTAPFGIFFGYLAGKFNCRKLLLVCGYAAVLVLYVTVGFKEDAGVAAMWVFSIAFGIAAGAVPMATYALIPILAADSKKSDYATAALAFCLQASNIIIGACGGLIMAYGYDGFTFRLLIPIAVLAVALAVITPSDRRVLAERSDA